MNASPRDRDWTLHELTVGNLIFGEAWFLGLPLSPDWIWRRGPSLPEVDSTVRRGGRPCVASGRAWYALHDHERGQSCELTIDIRPLRPAPNWERWSRGMATDRHTVGGHPADVARGIARRGLIKPVELRLLRVQLTCERTERVVRLEFVGNFPEEVLDEIQEGLAHLRCH